VRTVLQRLAQQSDRQVRAFALVALGQRAARTTLVERAVETRVFLAKRLGEGRTGERAWAAIALGVLEHGRRDPAETNKESVRATLLDALSESQAPDELAAVAIACGLARETSAVPLLIQRIEGTSDARVQGYLSLALGMIGDARAMPALRTVLAGARFRADLLRQSAIGLVLLEDRTLVPTLLQTLEKAASLTSQAAAASVIGWIGDQRALPGLLALVANRDVTASARGFAAVALGRVCDRDRLPWNAEICEDVHYRAATVTLNAGDGTGLLEIL
jgi:HEAT repeat protein